MLKKVGEKYREFELKKIQKIGELQIILKEIVHLPTGAQILHLGNEDKENLFCLSFQTLPKSSNGAPHVLEHTVLCGSEKFPVKDPFFSMSRRSLNTYMNALTGSDFTCYPAASQLEIDFYHLLDVYLDAVFHPKLLELSFLQEGWRFQFSEMGNLEVHGIVFNEMKGSLSSPDARVWKKMMHFLFPTLAYGHNAGGNPEDIPKLTYKELLNFHRTHYHPGRCLFFFYGNLPLQKHLDFLQEKCLKGVEKAAPLPLIPKERRYKRTLFKEDFYPGQETNEEIVALGYLTCSITEQADLLALQVLDLILMGTDASPLKHALLQSKLCKQADSFLEADISEMPFVFICKGCKAESAKKLHQLITKTLQKITKEGIATRPIESALHQLEIAKSEITGAQTPFGLSLFFRSGLLKQHGVAPEEGLKIHTLFESLRSCMEDPFCLNQYLEKYFLFNPHRVVLTMKPDPGLSSREEAEEKQWLKQVQERLGERSKQNIRTKTEALKQFQIEQEQSSFDILPKITLDDVEKHARKLHLLQESTFDFHLFAHECFTNKIVYADLHFDVPELLVEDLAYLRLFTTFLTEFGTGGRDYRHNLDFIQENLGGIGAFFSLNQSAENPFLFKPAFGIRGKALYRKIDKLFIQFRGILQGVDFHDQERLKDLLNQHLSSLENGINANALKYAISLSVSALNVPLQINHKMWGFEYLQSVRSIVKQPLQVIIDKFDALHKKLLGIKGAKLVLSLDQEALNILKGENFFDLHALCHKENKPFSISINLPQIVSQGFSIASPISYTAISLPQISYFHADSAALSIAGNLFENKVLHKKIREQGGAYGSGANANAMAGSFTFYTYRDPHILSSIQAFEESLRCDFDEKDIEEAKLGLIQDMDAPIAPGLRAGTAFSWHITGKSYAVREKFRTSLLQADKKSIKRAIEMHLLPHFEKAAHITFGGKELIERECPKIPIHSL